MLSINVRNIRINKDINRSSTDETDNDRPSSKQSPNAGNIDFRIEKVPPSIITFAQFMAVHVHDISLVVMVNNFEPNWFLHATAKEMHLDGSILHNTKSLVVTASLNDAQVKNVFYFSFKFI